MLIAVKSLAMVPSWPNEVHEARLQALQIYLGPSSKGKIAKVSFRIAIEMIQ